MPLSRCDETLTVPHPTNLRVALGVRLPCRYRLVEEIARGGMGIVLRVLDLDLNRPLALKVMRDEYAGNLDIIARFLDEARISGRLQHPGIVPIHELGRFPDGRPYFAMKLVEGRTLADLLNERKSPADDLPRLLAIFEQICQTIAFAHSQGVIHRDIKPNNVMVGNFGEVQVMDWGIAKQLDDPHRTELDSSAHPTAGVPPNWDPNPAYTTEGVVGTPAYMAPEQARGERIDARADVFGLGAVLCEILTSAPPFQLPQASTWHQGGRGRDLADAYSRLDSCKADRELITLAWHCLAEQAEDRPADAAAVLARVTAYREGVQERLHRAELERTAAAARRRAERRARSLLYGLTLAGLLLVGAGVVAAWKSHESRARTHARIDLLLQQANSLGQQARDGHGSEQALLRWRDASGLADQAWQLVEAGSVWDGDRQRVMEVRGRLRFEVAQLELDRAFVEELLDIRIQKEDEADHTDTTGRYRDAFARRGLNLERPTKDLAELLKQRPEALVREVVAALDDWNAESRRLREPEANWRPVLELANAVDDSSWRIALRKRIGSRTTARVSRELLFVDAVAGLTRTATLSPELLVTVLEAARHSDVRALARGADLERLPPASVLLFAEQLRLQGERDEAIRVMREAQRRTPGDVWLNYSLASALHRQPRPQLDDAIRFYTAARAGRPQLAHALAHALSERGRTEEAIALFEELIRQRPNNALHHNCLGMALKQLGRFDLAEKSVREAIRLKPRSAQEWVNLAGIYENAGRFSEAEQAARTALELSANHPLGLARLGNSLWGQGKKTEAEPVLRRAVALNAREHSTRFHLGQLLRARGANTEALALFREVVQLAPNYPGGHRELARLLVHLNRHTEALRSLENWARLDPRNYAARIDLAQTLRILGRDHDSLHHVRQAIALAPANSRLLSSAATELSHHGRRTEAIQWYEESLRLEPLGTTCYNLGNMYLAVGDQAAAVCCYLAALEKRPEDAEAACNLGHALRELGRFEEAVEALRRGHELGRKRGDAWRYPSATWVRHAESLVALRPRLKAIQAGEVEVSESLRLLAATASHHLGDYASEVRLLEEARPGTYSRARAASAAIRAGLGEGNDAPEEPESRAALRQRALRWLSEEVEVVKRLLADPKSRTRGQLLAREIEYQPAWRGARLAELPETERAEWEKLLASLGPG